MRQLALVCGLLAACSAPPTDVERGAAVREATRVERLRALTPEQRAALWTFALAGLWDSPDAPALAGPVVAELARTTGSPLAEVPEARSLADFYAECWGDPEARSSWTERCERGARRSAARVAAQARAEPELSTEELLAALSDLLRCERAALELCEREFDARRAVDACTQARLAQLEHEREHPPPSSFCAMGATDWADVMSHPDAGRALALLGPRATVEIVALLRDLHDAVARGG